MSTAVIAGRQVSSAADLPPGLVAQFIGRGVAIMITEPVAALVFPASTATPSQVGFAVRHSTGLIHAVMHSSRLDRLRIPDQPVLGSENNGCRFTVAVDAACNIGTGISARDRARTLRVLANPESAPDDVTRPGHILPIRCADDDAADATDRWSIAMRLVAMSGYQPVAAACELVTDEGDVLAGHAARHFAARHAFPVVELASMV